MNKNFWRIVEIVFYILKLIYEYDTRRTESQSAEYPAE